jgi:hypothetical protein
MADQFVTYQPPGPVAKAFLESGAFIRSIMGPIGSGKSVACIIELLRRAHLQVKGPDGLRHTRFAVVRNTYPDLKNTTLKSWLDWMPAVYGKLTMSSPITHRVVTDDIDMEVIFLALDRDEDVRKLMSLELTGLWINEARYIPKSILDGATGRVGRFPSVRDGGCTWAGVILDTNPPDTEHFIYRLAENIDLDMVEQTRKLEEELRLKGIIGPTQPLMEFFKQPSGLSPEAENIQNLRPGYYSFASVGKTDDYIKVYVRGEYGFVIEGKPVYPNYRDSLHTAKEKLEPLPGIPILVGADGGLTPAALFAQRTLSGRWRILSEVVTDDCGVTRFGELLLAHKAAHYPGYEIGGAWGDPHGTARGEDEEAWFTILNNVTGWGFRPAPTNDIELRLEAVTVPLNRLIDGLPAVHVSPTCTVYRKGFISGYHYRLVQASNGASVHETPAKNKFSHVHDAGQYLFLGGGEYEIVLGKTARSKPRIQIVAAGTGGDPFAEERVAPGVQYSNEKTMREFRDNRGKKPVTVAQGTGEDVY